MNLPLGSAAVLLALILPPMPWARADDAGEAFEEAIEHLTESQDQSLGAALAQLVAACDEQGGDDDCRLTALRPYLLRHAGKPAAPAGAANSPPSPAAGP